MESFIYTIFCTAAFDVRGTLNDDMEEIGSEFYFHGIFFLSNGS